MSATAGTVPASAAEPEPEPRDSEPPGFRPSRPRFPRLRASGPTPEEIQEPVMENLDRAITGVITVVPPLLLVLAGWQMWNRELRWRDVAIFLIMYIPIGLGVTVGFHRHAHPPQLQDLAAAARACWRCWARWRSRAR